MQHLLPYSVCKNKGWHELPTMDPFLLLLDFLAANEEASTQLMLLPHFAQLIKDLQCQLPGGRDDKGTKSV